MQNPKNVGHGLAMMLQIVFDLLENYTSRIFGFTATQCVHHNTECTVKCLVWQAESHLPKTEKPHSENLHLKKC
jgi:hypothetical protein